MFSSTRSLSLPALLCAFVALCFLTPTSRGEFTITFTESGGNVVANGTGSIDLTGLTFATTASLDTAVQANNPAYVGIGAPFSSLDAYTGITGPSSIGPGTTFKDADSGTGSGVAVNSLWGTTNAPTLFVPQGYGSGNTIVNSATWLGQTFSSLGLTPGTYTWTWGTRTIPVVDSLEVIVPGTSVVPEPSSLVLAGTAIGVFGLCLAVRRRRAGAFAA